nr:ECF transporter S component [Longispora sp. (in: high G+C Gram-positive bacteria)]
MNLTRLNAIPLNAIPLRKRSIAAIVLASVFGVAAVGWPLLVAPTSALAHGTEAPWVLAVMLPLVLAVALAEIGEG